jgi:hypothetical protein
MLRSDAVLLPYARFDHGTWRRLAGPAEAIASNDWLYYESGGDSGQGVLVQPPSTQLELYAAPGEWGYTTTFKPIHTRPVDYRHPVGLAVTDEIDSRFFAWDDDTAVYNTVMKDFVARESATFPTDSLGNTTEPPNARSVTELRAYSRIKRVTLSNGKALVYAWILKEYASGSTPTECAFVKWYQAWAIEDMGKLRLLAAGLELTDCDRRKVTLYNPFALVDLEGASFVQAEYAGSESMCRTVLRVENDAIADLLRDSC